MSWIISDINRNGACYSLHASNGEDCTDIRMVKRLSNFIQALQPANWLLHLRSAERMVLDFFSMNWMKYHRMWPVYIADMYDLQHRAPDVWAGGDYVEDVSAAKNTISQKQQLDGIMLVSKKIK